MRSPKGHQGSNPCFSAKNNQVSDKQLQRAVEQSFSYAGVLRILGLKQGGGTQSLYRKRIARLAFDVSHFTGQSHALGGKGFPCCCVVCGKEISSLGLASHLRLAHTKEGSDQTKRANEATRGKPSPLKGKALSGDHKIKLSRSLTGRVVPELIREAIRAGCRRNKKSGGLRKGGGRGKRGWYKGFWCDSTWELAFILFHLDHNIPISRCSEVRLYEWENSLRKYHPDFVVNGKVVEIKGFSSPQWRAKHAANPDVVGLFYCDIQPYLKYAIEKYGSNFESVYEKQP